MHEIEFGDFMSEKRATLKDVAERSGYALRTVKNVVAGKSSVGEPVREAVLKAMKELDYKPNFLASTLAKNRSYLVAAVICEGDNEHQKGIREGFERFARQYGDYGLKIELHFTRRDVHAQEVVLEEFYERDELDGVILQPASPTLLSRQINLLMFGGKPVALVGTDTLGCERLCYVGPKQTQIGRVSAQLLGGYLKGAGSVLVIYEDDTRPRADAFGKYLLEHYPEIQIRMLNPQKTEAMPFEKVMINTAPDGVYDCTENERYLAWMDMNMEKGDRVILTNDISLENRERMKRGLIDLMVGAETEEMGYLAAESIFHYISASEIPEKTKHTRITILTDECF